MRVDIKQKDRNGNEKLEVKVSSQNVNLWYGPKHALLDVNFDI